MREDGVMRGAHTGWRRWCDKTGEQGLKKGKIRQMKENKMSDALHIVVS